MKRFFQKKPASNTPPAVPPPLLPQTSPPPQPSNAIMSQYQKMSVEQRQQVDAVLIDAGINGNLATIKDCIFIGVNVEAQREDTWRTIHTASFNGHLPIVQYLVEYGRADVQATIKDGYTALHASCMGGHLEIVRYLIQNCRVDASTPTNDGTTTLQLACFLGRADIVRYLIQECQVDVSKKDQNGFTALHAASQEGHLEITQYIVSHGRGTSDITRAVSHDGTTLLHSASFKGHLNMVRYFIEDCQLDVEIKDLWGDTAYDIARQKNYYDVAEYLSRIVKRNQELRSDKLDPIVEEFVAAAGDGDMSTVMKCIHSGVDMEAQNCNQWKALHYACLRGHLHIVRQLIEQCGTNVEGKDYNGRTPLHIASKYGHLEVVRYLIENCRACPEINNNFGISPLHFASIFGHMDIVQFLVEKCGVDKNRTTVWGKTAGQIARENEKNEVADYLFNIPSTPSLNNATMLQQPTSNLWQPQQQDLTMYQKMSPLEREQMDTLFVDAGVSGSLDTINQFIVIGGDVNAQRNSDSFGALHTASFNGHLHIVQYLVVQCRVNVNAKTKDGFSALHFACFNGHLDIVRYLLHDCHVDLNTKTSNGFTALHLTCLQGHLDTARYLIQDCRVAVSTQSHDGWTVLHAASENGHLDIVQYLVKVCHICVTTTSNEGGTALHSASFKGHLNVVRYLIEECHVEVKIMDCWGDTAYDVARQSNCFDVAEYLSLVVTRSQELRSVKLDHLVEEFVAAAGDGDMSKVVKCISNGVDKDAQNWNLWKALHFACLHGHLHIVRYLIEQCGTTVEGKDYNGRTPLHLACKHGRLELARYLIENCRADVETNNSFEITPLHYASAFGHMEIVQFLVEKCGVDTSIPTSWGKTACVLARDNEKNEIAAYLAKIPEKVIRNHATEVRLPSFPVYYEKMVANNDKVVDDNKLVDDGKVNNTSEIVTDRKQMEIMINDPFADPVVLSLQYLELCTDNFTSKVLGEGAFGKVYFGCDKEIGLQLAVKRISLQIPDQDALNEITMSFKREIAVLKRFRHPNIVVMYGYNVLVKQNSQFLVYEYLSNGALALFLKDEKGRTRLSNNTRLSIMFQLARSVHFLHTGGCDNLTVFHRDIKSGNICLTQDYTAKLIDCGLAKFVPDSSGDAIQGTVTPTMLKSSGAAVFGTPGYICPVYSRGQSQYTAACDVFAVGVVFAELLVGSLQGGQSSRSGPSLGDFFCRYIKDDEDEPVENGWKILMQDADLVAQWNDDILERLCKLAVQCMAASPKRRISTLSLVDSLSEISSYDFTAVANMGSASGAPDLIDVQQLNLSETTDADINSGETKNSNVAQNCVLCNRSSFNTVTCVDSHRTCVQCIEQAIQVHMGKSGDSFQCKCGSLIHDSALFGKISMSTYNCYIRERSLQKVIEEKFDGMKLQLNQISSMSERNHEQVMVSLKAISSNIQRVLGGLAYVATNSVQQCPTAVWLVPADRTAGNSAKAWKQWARNITHKRYDLYFVCQHSFEVVETKMEITVPRPWLTQAAPALVLSMFLLKTALTIGGLPALPFPIPTLSRSDQILMNEEFVTDLLDNATLKLMEAFKAAYTQGSDLSYSESSQLLALTGASYEGIVAKATSMKRCHWKQSMEPVANHQGSIIWIKKEYRGFY